MSETEMWKDIPGYEGLYQASSLGRIRSVTRMVNGRGDIPKPLNGKILKQNSSGRYNRIELGRGHYESVHRIIAITFVPNPNNYPEVNHIDGNKKNNSPNNLEWCNRSQNQIHAYRTGLQKPYSIGTKGKPIVVLDIEGHELNRFNRIKDCANEMGLRAQSIMRVLKNKRAHYHKMVFKYL